MGEIKSTLDIIMDKLKSLEVTEKDRERLRLEELEGKIKALFNKYKNGLMDESELTRELNTLKPETCGEAKRLILENITSIVEIEGRSINCLALLTKLYPKKEASFHKLDAQLKNNIRKKEKELAEKMKKRLASMGIKGDAVIPNIYSTEEWLSFIATEKKRVSDEIKKIINSN